MKSTEEYNYRFTPKNGEVASTTCKIGMCVCVGGGGGGGGEGHCLPTILGL